jgi:uncharacterized protein (TIGR02246 family)
MKHALAVMPAARARPRTESPNVQAERQAEDEQAIRKIIAELTSAWNGGNRDWVGNYSENAELINILGNVIQGRDQIEKRHAAMLSTFFPGAHLAVRIRKIRFLRPDVALAETDAEFTGYKKLPSRVKEGPGGSVRTRLNHVLTKENGRWQIAASQDTDVKPVLSVARLNRTVL